LTVIVLTTIVSFYFDFLSP